MKTPPGLCSFAALAAALLTPALAHAGNGTWNNPAGGLWSAEGNWVGGAPANIATGAGFTADFSTLDITATTTVSLDSPRTIGNLIFGDTATGTAANWVLNNNSNAGNILTMDVGDSDPSNPPTPTITVNALGTNATTTISAVLAGNDGLAKAGAGTLVLGAANTYTGATAVSEGTLAISNSSALNGTTVTVTSGARLQLQGGVTIGGSIINLNGSSAFANGASGNNVIANTSTINLQSASTISANTGSTSLTIDSSINHGSNALTLSTSNSANLTVNGLINGGGSLTKSGNAAVTISGNQSSFTGNSFLTGGTLIFGGDGALGSGGTIGTFTFGVNDSSVTMRSSDTGSRTLGNAIALAGNANSTHVFGSTTASVNGNILFSNAANISMGSISRKFSVNNTTQFNGGFTGTGGITKQTGTGVLILAGTNTYTGATAVNAGTMIVEGSLAAGSAVTVASGAGFGGNGTVNGTLTVTGFLTPGNSGLGSLDTTNDVTWNGTAGQDWRFELGLTTGSSDQLLITGANSDFLKGTGTDFRFDFQNTGVIGQFILVDWADTAVTGFSASDFTYTNLAAGLTGSFAITGSQLVFTTVPEPSTGLLLALGLLGMSIRRRKIR